MMTHDRVAEEPFSSTTTPAVRWLIGVSIALYVVQLTLISAPDVRAALAFEMRDLDGALWTVATHPFVHASFASLLVSVATLRLFGPRLESAWGRGQFVTFFAVCALGGWLFHVFFVRHGAMFGSTAGVLGVMLAYAARWPEERVRVLAGAGLEIRWVVAALALGNLAVGVGAEASGLGYLAHIGGLFAGATFLRLAGSMHLDRLRQRVAPVPDEPEEMPPRAFPRSLPRSRGGREQREVDDIVAQSHAAVAEATSRAGQPTPATPPVVRVANAELNALLDKISAQGLTALTLAERRKLEEEARRLRDE